MSKLPAHVREFRKLSQSQRTAWTEFLRASSRIVSELNGDMERRHGLTLSAFDVLVMLSHTRAEGCAMGELSERLLLSQSGITRTLERLERDGLAERFQAADDTRRRIARITDAGMAKLAEATPDHVRAIRREFLDELTEDQTELIAEVFTRLNAARERTTHAS
jgi:DNA-binding MarR family transcriptional regulator